MAVLFNLAPANPSRCQTGWSLSLTPYCLRKPKEGKTALEIFVEDAIHVHKQVKQSTARKLVHSLFHESSLLAMILSGGNVENALFSALAPGSWGELIVRRFATAMLDSGTIKSACVRPNAVAAVAVRSIGLAA